MEIAKVWNGTGYTDNYYKENDRYNGKTTDTITNKKSGFWAVLTAEGGPLESAQAVYDKATATQDEVNAAAEDLSAAITKLIPAGQFNATDLYELTHEDLVWSGQNLVDASTTYDGVPLSADSTSSASLKEYQEAKAAAVTELGLLFSGGVATDYNKSSDGQAKAKAAETRLKNAKAGLDRLADDNKLADAQIAYNSLGNLANRVFTPNLPKVVSSYDADSWSTWLTVRSTALTFLNSHVYPQKGVGVNEAEKYVTQAKTLWDACYQDLTGAAAGTAYIHVTDPDFFLNPGGEFTKYAGCYEVAVPAEGIKLSDALNTALGDGWQFTSRRDGFGFGVFLNGIYLYNQKNNLSGGSPASRGYGNVKLKAGDVVTLTLITFPLNDAHGYVSYIDMHGGIRSADLSDATGETIRTLEAVSGAETKLTAQYLQASPVDYTGLKKPLAGATVYISAVCATKAEAMRCPATRVLGSVTAANGSFTLSLPAAVGSAEGWYLLNLLPADENAGLVASPYLLIHVSDPADLRELKANLKAELETAYTAFENDFYTAAQLAEIKTLYEQACPAIDAAATSGDADAAFHTAYDRITEIQTQNENSLTLNLKVVRNLLELLPTAEDLAAGRLYKTDKAVLDLLFAVDGWYTRMTAYHKDSLSSTEAALLKDLLSAYEDSNQGANLPAQPAFTVKFEVRDVDTGELLNVPFTYNDNTQYVFCQDYTLHINEESGDLLIYPSESVSRELTYDADTNTFTLPTESYSMVRLLLNIRSADLGEYEEAEGGQAPDVDPHYLYNWREGLLRYEFHTLRQNMTVTHYLKKADALANAITAAVTELNGYFQTKYRTEYTEANWETLTQKYNEGLNSIRTTDSTEAVPTALDAAKKAIDDVAKKPAGDYGSVTVTVENTTWTKAKGAPWDGVLVKNVPVDLTATSTMMGCIETALDGYTVVGAQSGYISSIKGIAEFDGGTGAGWMGSLNDWFVNEGFANFTVADGKLHDGDVICVMYTCALGEDIRAGVEGNSDTSLYSLTLSGGTLEPTFAPTVTDYVFTLESGVSATTISFSGNNRSFQARGYLNSYAPTANNWVRSGDTVPVSGGDMLYVGVGEGNWPSMGSGTPTKYQISIVSPDSGEAVIKLISAIGSVTYTNYKDKQAAVNKAKAAYNALSAEGKAGVSNYATLTAAEAAIAGFEAVDSFKAELAAFPSDMAQATKAELQALADDCDALGANKSLLTVAETSKVERARSALNGIIQEETTAEKQGRVDAVKAAIEALDFTVAQATANDAAALKTYAEGVIADVDLDGATAVLTVSSVTPAVAGTAEDADGSDGKYTVSVTLTLDSVSATATVTDAAITATAYVAPVPTITWQEALEGVQAYVAEQVPNPGVGSTKGEWAVFALNRGGVATEEWNNSYLGNLQTYVDECNGELHDKKYTEYSRVVIALTSLGYDGTQFKTATKTYDLVTPLLDKQQSGAYWAEWQGNNGTAFALLALDSHNYLDNADGKAARAALIASLKANQMESGAWSISGGAADLDVTAAAVYALAPYYLDSSKLAALSGSVSYDEVKAMVDNALAFLSGKQNAQGGFGSVEADVWTLIALSTLGRDADTDAAFVKDGGSLLADVLRYYDKDSGGFKHLLSGSVDQMGSEQAAYGLAAYDRFKTGKTALYDMSDVTLTLPPKETVAVTGVTLAPTASVEVGKTVTRKATVEPSNATDKTVTWSSEDSSIATVSGGVVTGVKAGEVKITATAGGKSAECTVTVTAKSSGGGTTPKDDTITVTMRLIGAEKATKDVDLGVTPAYLPDYVTWIPTTTYVLDKGATVYDLWVEATCDAGITSVGAANNYVETVYAPDDLGGYKLSEFTNGYRSGWMYTINGRHPGYGLVEQALHDGDTVIWHYINDYSYECEDWFGDDPNYPALGDGTYWNQWLKAPDTYGAKGGGVGNENSGGGTSGGSDGKTDGTATGTETTNDTNTVIADDGSKVSTETEKTVDTKENEDGSVTETVTETTTTTVTAPDGNTSVTETAVETETTTNSVENADGSVTETTGTVEKVTETVTAADGTKTTVVTETEETRQVSTTVGEDGKVSGAGTVSATSTVTDENGNVLSTAVTEGTVAVDTDEQGTVSAVTTATTTTTDAEGNVTETVTVTTEAEMTDGTTAKVVADGEGNTLSAEAEISEAALNAALESGEPIRVPATVRPTDDPEKAAPVRITLPELAAAPANIAEMPRVEIEVTQSGSGVVAFEKQPDGTMKLVKECRIGSVIVPVSGSCELVIVDNSKSFSDVSAAAWYGDSVDYVTAREVFNGMGDGTFAPGEKMNRAMAAQIIYNFDREAEAGDGSSFKDVSAEDWFSGAVGWAAANGIIVGYDGGYAPTANITRQDLVTVLWRYMKTVGYDVEGAEADLLAYADGEKVSDYAAEAMRWAISTGVITGYPDGTLHPRSTATRAEVAAIMQRMIEKAMK